MLDLLAQGLIYKEIADKLNIGYETVHTYIRRIYEKLQVRTRTEAVAKFLQKIGAARLSRPRWRYLPDHTRTQPKSV